MAGIQLEIIHGYLQVLQTQTTQDMLNGVNRFLLLCVLISSCEFQAPDDIEDLTKKIESKAQKTIGKTEYNLLYNSICDSVNSWCVNDLICSVEYKDVLHIVDSSFCINSRKNKMFGVLISMDSNPKSNSDGIEEFYGAKIEGKWYFWTGGYMPVLRKPFKGHNPKKPLSYAQLHSQAIDWMGGYLKKDGSINDEWFEFMFKQGFSGKNTFRDRYLTRNRLNGHKIDTEKEFWDYTFKKLGLGLWIGRSTNDSISKYNTLNPNNKLSNEQETEICNYITQRYMNMLEKLKLK